MSLYVNVAKKGGINVGLTVSPLFHEWTPRLGGLINSGGNLGNEDFNPSVVGYNRLHYCD